MPALSLARLRKRLPGLQYIFPFLSWFGLVNRDTIKADLTAGLTGAVIVLPQGVAFAIIAGLPPQYGLYTAMVTPVVAALFGSSWHLISGPTTAISIVVFAAVSHYAEPGTPQYIEQVLTITFLAGVYQLAFGIARMGMLVNFVSHTVVVGFTAGAGILILTSQMKNVLGLKIPKGEAFLDTWVDVWLLRGAIDLMELLVAGITLLVAILVKIVRPRWPNLLLAMIIGSLAALALPQLGGGQVALIGAIPAGLPDFSVPDLSFGAIKILAPEAFAVALLGLIEAVSISRAIAAKSHQRIDGNQEFIGQGMSNLVGSFFSAYAGSGSFTRSGINYAAGARTPMSALFAAAFLIVIVIAVAPLTAYLPMAAMGGVIVMVAYNLVDTAQIKHVIESSKSETAILLTTFFSTLFLELEFAIYLGVLLSLVIFLARTSTPEIVTLGTDYDARQQKRVLVDVRSKPLDECPALKILRVDMSIYFGSLNHIQKRLFKISERQGIPNILIIGSGINFIDLSGAEMLREEAERLQQLGGGLYFAGLKPSAYNYMNRSHTSKAIGNAHFFDVKAEAIRAIHKTLRAEGRCQGCSHRAFSECQKENIKI